MRTGVHVKAVVVGMAFAAVAFQPERAAADPISLTVNLSGVPDLGAIVQDWMLTFPTFTVAFSDTSRLQPGFCLDCPDGSLLPLTQMTGAVSVPAIIGSGTTFNGNVALDFSFVGPTVVATLDQFGAFTATEPVQLSGMLDVTQGPAVLFQGTIVGSGSGTVSIEPGPSGSSRFGGYEYRVDAVSATPEPASIVLLGTGVVLWLVPRRRRV